MKSQVKRLLRIVFGWIFVAFGIAGLFLPFLQGILFLLIGLYLLSHDSRWARRLFLRIKERYPKLYRKFKETRVSLEHRLRKIWRRC